MRLVAPLVALLVVALGRRAAAEVSGGGLADADCRVVLRGVTATTGASGVVCVDGDVACDLDGVADGTCRFTVQVCTGTPTAECDTRPLSAIGVAGLALAPPPLPAPDDTCGPPLGVGVAAGSAEAATLLARQDTQLRDVDYLNLCCVSAVDRFTPARCALAVDPTVSGCATRRIPRGVRAAFAQAAAALDGYAEDPGRPQLLRRARRRVERLRAAGQRVAGRDACGNALGLVASHAADALRGLDAGQLRAR